METQPALPPDEAELDANAVDLLLSNLGSDMVLVGGQALAFWMARYGIESGQMVITNDGDALGKVGRAIDLANAIKARVTLPDKESRTALVAQLRLPAPNGKERNIDVLHKLFTIAGLRKSSIFTKKVIEDSVLAEWRPGRYIRVMDPFDVLESRAQNAVGLFDLKGEHVLTQARWGIEVAREALLRIARDEASCDRLGVKIQRIYTLARSSVGRRLLKERDIELLNAIDLEALRNISPSHALQLDAVESERTKRQSKRQSPKA